MVTMVTRTHFDNTFPGPSRFCEISMHLVGQIMCLRQKYNVPLVEGSSSVYAEYAM